MRSREGYKREAYDRFVKKGQHNAFHFHNFWTDEKHLMHKYATYGHPHRGNISKLKRVSEDVALREACKVGVTKNNSVHLMMRNKSVHLMMRVYRHTNLTSLVLSGDLWPMPRLFQQLVRVAGRRGATPPAMVPLLSEIDAHYFAQRLAPQTNRTWRRVGGRGHG